MRGFSVHPVATKRAGSLLRKPHRYDRVLLSGRNPLAFSSSLSRASCRCKDEEEWPAHAFASVSARRQILNEGRGPNAMASWRFKKRGDLENLSCPLSQVSILHTLTWPLSGEFVEASEQTNVCRATIPVRATSRGATVLRSSWSWSAFLPAQQRL